jgi:hypothetical protein
MIAMPNGVATMRAILCRLHNLDRPANAPPASALSMGSRHDGYATLPHTQGQDSGTRSGCALTLGW